MNRASARPRLAGVAVGLLGIAVVAGGCGGSKSSTDQAKSTVSSFFTAAGQGKGDTACAMLTDTAVKEVTSAAFLLKPPSSCSDAIKTFSRLISSQDKKSLEATKVSKVTVTGNTATVADNDIQPKSGCLVGLLRDNTPDPMTLENVGGTWKISSLG